MLKVAVLVSLVISGSVFAAESKKNDLGFTKEQHMAALAACKAINADMQGRELKECIKQKLGLSAQ